MAKRVVWTSLVLLLVAGIIVYAMINQKGTPWAFAADQTGGGKVSANAMTNWSMFHGDLAHTGYNAHETAITTATAPNLHVKWSVTGIRGVSAQPVVFNGKVFWGSWDGYEHATDMNGQQIWAKNLGTAQGKCRPLTSGVAGTAAVASVSINGTMTDVVFVGGGDTNFYALNADNGAVIWHTPLGSTPDHFIWAGAAVYNGSVYVGVASYGDCPLVQGSLVKMDAQTGEVQHVFKTVADNCLGGGIWDTPTIDTATGMIYVSTGTRTDCTPSEDLATALLKLRASDLSLVDSWQVPPAQTIPDGDFGSTPTLFQATIGDVNHNMVGLINKNGVYFAFDRNAIGAGPVWKAQLGNKQIISKVNMSSSAWDGQRLYIGSGHTTINGKVCNGALRALNPASGAFIWERCLSEVPFDSAMTVPGLVVLGDDANLLVVNAKTGKTVYKFIDQAAMVSKHLYSWGNPVIVNGMLFAGNMAGNFYTISL